LKLTTTNLRLPSPRRWCDLPVPVTASICIFAILALTTLVGKLHTAPTIAAVPTPALPAPIFIIATSMPLPTAARAPAAVVAAAPPNTLRRAVVAYDSPNGNSIGGIEPGRAYTVLARFGAEWLQADVTGSGVVWLKADQVLDLPADLVDLQPAPAPQIVYHVVNQPAAAEPAAAAAATPEPYQVTSDAPAGDVYTTPPHVDPAAQQALIGSDPNALACNGSVFCGGLTNAEAQAALDAQRATR
jgi:hypothetical protein